MSTLVVYADASDGYIESFSDLEQGGSYTAARSGSNLGADVLGGFVVVGQAALAGDSGEPDYIPYDIRVVREAFLAFDTSAIASGDSVSDATLRLTSHNDFSTTDFTVNARSYDWGATLTTADWIAGGSLSGYTLRAHYATSSGWTANTAYDFTDDALAAGVVKAGTTRLVLASSRTEGNNEPTGYEYVTVKSADTSGTTSDPKLTITYTAGSTAKEASVTATGGGVAAVTDRTGRTRSNALTGGGVATAAETTARRVSPTATGGGVATATARIARSASIAATGGGAATVSVQSARQLAALLSAGGVLAHDPTSARASSAVATGGGRATVDGGTTVSVIPAPETGGTVWRTRRPTALEGEDHEVSVTATGGGSVTVRAVGDWHDDDVMERILAALA